MDRRVEDMCSFASRYFSIKITDLYSKTRKGNCITAKHLIWFILHYEYGFKTSELSREFFRSRRDVFLGISKIKSGIKNQKYYKDLYEKFITEYKNGSKD